MIRSLGCQIMVYHILWKSIEATPESLMHFNNALGHSLKLLIEATLHYRKLYALTHFNKALGHCLRCCTVFWQSRFLAEHVFRPAEKEAEDSTEPDHNIMAPYRNRNQIWFTQNEWIKRRQKAEQSQIIALWTSYQTLCFASPSYSLRNLAIKTCKQMCMNMNLIWALNSTVYWPALIYSIQYW